MVPPRAPPLREHAAPGAAACTAERSARAGALLRRATPAREGSPRNASAHAAVQSPRCVPLRRQRAPLLEGRGSRADSCAAAEPTPRREGLPPTQRVNDASARVVRRKARDSSSASCSAARASTPAQQRSQQRVLLRARYGGGVGRLGGAMQRSFRQLPTAQLGCNSRLQRHTRRARERHRGGDVRYNREWYARRGATDLHV